MDHGFIKRSLSESVSVYFKDKILSGALKSGDKLVELDIAEELGISRAPIREALRSLSEQGMITFSPRRGNQILELTRAETIEVFTIRVSLEMQILYMLVVNQLLRAEDYQHLEDLIARMSAEAARSHSEQDQVYLLNSLDLAFHSYLWKASGSLRRAQLLEGLFLQLLIKMNQNVASLGSFEEKAQEHRQIITSLHSNKVAQVQQEFAKHLQTYIIAAIPDITAQELDFIQALTQKA